MSAEPTFRGTCRLVQAFDVGNAIDLAAAAERLSPRSERGTLKLRHTAPRHFQFEPPPVRLALPAEPVAFGRWRSEPERELWLYDFGALSVGHAVRFEGDLEAWIELSCALSESRELEREARGRAGEVLAQLGDCVQRPELAVLTEDYAIFELGSLPAPEEDARGPDAAADALLARHGHQLARLLRAERGPLSGQEAGDALSAKVAFGRDDLALLDWNAAVLFDPEPDDARAVLELANVQLLELRHLDRQLDLALDRAYDVHISRGWQRARVGRRLLVARDEVAGMQVEGAVLFERVGNVLKLVNDQHLARVYRQALQRFRMAEWNGSVLRKLETLDGLYQKLQDRADTRRMEVLEWIIIVLIAVSLVLPFLGVYG